MTIYLFVSFLFGGFEKFNRGTPSIRSPLRGPLSSLRERRSVETVF